MEITEIRIRKRKPNPQNRLKATASVTFDNQFVVHGIKILDSEKGTFIAMPSKRTREGKFTDTAHPINQDTRMWLQEAILEKYATAEDPVDGEDFEDEE